MRKLFYPCCAGDWRYFVKTFLNKVDKFIFADLNYDDRIYQRFLFELLKYDGIERGSVRVKKIGKFSKKKIKIEKDRFFQKGYYWDVTPEYFRIKFRFKGNEKEVVFRRGFGQCALYEIEKESLDYFVHRGDSTGEGGSNVFFLSTNHRRYEPISQLYYKILERLKPEGYIISDGSNVGIPRLRYFYREIHHITKEELLERLPITIKSKKSTLELVDVLDRRYGHTIVWKVNKELDK